MNNTIKVLGVPIQNVTLDGAVTTLLEAARSKESLMQAAFVNADCLNIATENKEYQKMLTEIPLVFADGSGIRYASKMLETPVKDNVNGTDLFPMVCEQAAEEGLSIYLLGGKPGVSDKVASRIRRRYPKLFVAGNEDGYFREEDVDAVIARINESGADILMVALGAPFQDLWINKHKHEIKCGVALGVGGLFDFAAKEVGRAPKWVRNMGMEWVVRLLNEPLRLARRYLIGNPLFLWRCYQEVKSLSPERKAALLADASAIERAAGQTDQADSGMNGKLAEKDAANDQAVVRHFDIWRDFEMLDEIEVKYASLASTSGRLKAKKLSDKNKRKWVSRTRFFSRAKRALDLVVAASALIGFAPIFLLTALAIYVDNPGPIFFKQVRVGRYGSLFNMFKFRSMIVNAEKEKTAIAHLNESAAGVLFKMKKDPRITRVGNFIRKYSIDELPQLINVLTGDMALVGPRPPLPSEVALYSLEERRRLDVRPGITCIWQVSGRSDIDFEGQVKLDLQYIRVRSVYQDLKILFSTIPAVIKGKGAY